MNCRTDAPGWRVFNLCRVSSQNTLVAHSGATGRDVGGVCQGTEELFAAAKG